MTFTIFLLVMGVIIISGMVVALSVHRSLLGEIDKFKHDMKRRGYDED